MALLPDAEFIEGIVEEGREEKGDQDGDKEHEDNGAECFHILQSVLAYTSVNKGLVERKSSGTILYLSCLTLPFSTVLLTFKRSR